MNYSEWSEKKKKAAEDEENKANFEGAYLSDGWAALIQI